MKPPLNPDDWDMDLLEYWLRSEDPAELQELWYAADKVRKQHVGDAVHLRGIIEISNYCVRQCAYCGIFAGNAEINRYRMDKREILSTVQSMDAGGYATVVLQAGEDYGLKSGWISTLLRNIKNETNMAVTLSLGERPAEDLYAWKQAGADRYLLKLETGNEQLYRAIHPPRSGSRWRNRMEILTCLKDLGYETGSGIMLGIPGQRFRDVAADLILFRDFGIDMLGMGPFIAHPKTPLAGQVQRTGTRDQVPSGELMTYKTVALTRLLCPDTNLPTTSALVTLNGSSGRELGLQRGANVIMPNFTPLRYRRCYEIYPGRICLQEFGVQMQDNIRERIRSVGRTVASGTGASVSYRKRQNAPMEKINREPHVH